MLGAGLIGGALAERLVLRGHEVSLATRGGRARPGMRGLALDLAALPDDARLRDALACVDIVVNTVGIFVAGGQQSFDAVHVNGPRRVFEAARRAGSTRWIQLSALGADGTSPVPYFASKGRMDEILLAADDTQATVVRPSLVFAPGGNSTRLFAQLASLPATPLPRGGRQEVQPLHLDDLVDALVGLVEADDVPRVLDAVGPRALSLRDYLQVFKRATGIGSAFVAIPMAPMRWIAGLAPRLHLPFDADALAMLEAGSTADPQPFQRWLGRAARDPGTFVDPGAAGPLRHQAVLAWSVPLMRFALALMWLATAVVSLWVYPREDSLALVAQLGLHGRVAIAALWAGALCDLALGLGILWRPSRTLAYALQIALVTGYTLIISLWLPEQWAHPFGPVLKNLPLLAMTLALLMLDRTHGPDPR